MDIDTIRLFSEYNKITNSKMNGYISQLSHSQWEMEFKGFFSSVKLLCNHIYIGDFNWLRRLSGLREFHYIKKDIFSKTINFNEIITVSVDNYLGLRAELDIEIENFINEVNGEDLGKLLKFKDSRGNEYEKIFGGLIIHMFNHETHHRGMISIYLEEMGIENDYSNLMGIL